MEGAPFGGDDVGAEERNAWALADEVETLRAENRILQERLGRLEEYADGILDDDGGIWKDDGNLVRFEQLNQVSPFLYHRLKLLVDNRNPGHDSGHLKTEDASGETAKQQASSPAIRLLAEECERLRQEHEALELRADRLAKGVAAYRFYSIASVDRLLEETTPHQQRKPTPPTKASTVVANDGQHDEEKTEEDL